MAKCLPHCSHLCLEFSDLQLIFVRPSLWSIESTVKDLMEKTGGERGERGERGESGEDMSDVAGDSGGEEHSLEL